MAYLEFFDPRRLALQQELTKHPDIAARIGNHIGSNAQFEMILAELCAEFFIIIDGDYTQEGLDNLCDILTQRLMERRTLILHS